MTKRKHPAETAEDADSNPAAMVAGDAAETSTDAQPGELHARDIPESTTEGEAAGDTAETAAQPPVDEQVADQAEQENPNDQYPPGDLRRTDTEIALDTAPERDTTGKFVRKGVDPDAEENQGKPWSQRLADSQGHDD